MSVGPSPRRARADRLAHHVDDREEVVAVDLHAAMP